MSGPAQNTDRELYREPKGDLPSDYYANSVHVTAEGTIGMNVGGTVYALPITTWHALAAQAQAPEPQGGGLTHDADLFALADEWDGALQRQYDLGTKGRDYTDWHARQLREVLAARAVPAETLADRVRAAIERWGIGDEDDWAAHVVVCQDFGCKTCVVIACASDIAAALAPIGGDVGSDQ